MKYVAFALAMLMTIPGAVVAGYSRRIFALAVFVMFLPILKFDSLALNFISWEFYRGTSRGMEVSFIYIMALMMLMAMKLRGFRLKLLPDLGFAIYLMYFGWGVFTSQYAITTEVEAVIAGGYFQPSFTISGKLLSFFELWKMGMMALVFVAVYNVIDYLKEPKTILRALAFVVISIFVLVVKEHFVGVYQARGPFPHQNSMAVFLMMVTPIFLAGYLTLPKDGFRTFLSAAFVCGSGALFRTYSRGAMVMYPFACAITTFAAFVHRFSARMVTRLLPLVVVALLGFLALLPKIVDRFENAPTQSGDTRKWLARTALAVASNYPLTGAGINNWSNFVTVHPELQDEEFRPTGTTSSQIGIVETIYLLTLGECGFPGLALLLCWFIYYWCVALKLTVKLAHTEYFMIPAGLLGGLTGSFIQSCLEWVLKQQLNFILMMTCFATLAWLNRHWRELKRNVV